MTPFSRFLGCGNIRDSMTADLGIAVAALQILARIRNCMKAGQFWGLCRCGCECVPARDLKPGFIPHGHRQAERFTSGSVRHCFRVDPCLVAVTGGPTRMQMMTALLAEQYEYAGTIYALLFRG
ncbi:MAG: hypothetical protein R2941_21010 [Desulfobacterales bacterium]